MKIEMIKWIDHSTFAQNLWRTKEELDQLDDYVVTSVGKIVTEGKNHLIIASHIASNGTYGGEFRILKGTIIKRKVLKKK